MNLLLLITIKVVFLSSLFFFVGIYFFYHRKRKWAQLSVIVDEEMGGDGVLNIDDCFTIDDAPNASFYMQN